MRFRLLSLMVFAGLFLASCTRQELIEIYKGHLNGITRITSKERDSAGNLVTSGWTLGPDGYFEWKEVNTNSPFQRR